MTSYISFKFKVQQQNLLKNLTVENLTHLHFVFIFTLIFWLDMHIFKTFDFQNFSDRLYIWSWRSQGGYYSVIIVDVGDKQFDLSLFYAIFVEGWSTRKKKRTRFFWFLIFLIFSLIFLIFWFFWFFFSDFLIFLIFLKRCTWFY